ncbi:glycosyltransferase family protein [Erythrobacter dokdonensis]|uniref:Glycosyltransferase n=1 Tax=Erythrobacter dokdonensis DSW-74 TaxID=1300349 RepID=A0A1A7BID3_9SPHN|nr:glycosyltransferase [Erythrobacter dokdonensis]OBV11207.1 hypothetical protein I603_1615 [Erythrobacter dokdonensis DSW-74]
MKIGLLSNEKLPRGINWTLLSDPLFADLHALGAGEILAPPPPGLSTAGEYLRLAGRAQKMDAFFSMHGKARPEWPLQALSWAAGRVLRAVFYVDPWKHAIDRIAQADRLFGHDLVFVPYAEALRDLEAKGGRTRYIYLPFACDTEVFRPREVARDIDILWMGRRDPMLHRSLLALSEQRGLNYQYRETTGFLDDPRDLGLLAARSRYFVVTPPEPERSGGYSPLLMRYFEGLAAGCRLLGTLPASGEFEALLPRDSLLEVAGDGSDLASRYDADQGDDAAWAATREAMRLTREHHGWRARATTIIDELARAWRG